MTFKINIIQYDPQKKNIYSIAFKYESQFQCGLFILQCARCNVHFAFLNKIFLL